MEQKNLNRLLQFMLKKIFLKKNKNNIANQHIMDNSNSLIEKQRQCNMNRQKMSIDSLHIFTTNYIVDELQKASMTILKTDSVEPQVWFTDKNG